MGIKGIYKGYIFKKVVLKMEELDQFYITKKLQDRCNLDKKLKNQKNFDKLKDLYNL